MRLVYLDEAGTDFRTPVICVAGVIVHGDKQWLEIDRRILDLVDKYVEPQDRLGFIFHTTDVFHGSRYFDRRKPKWNDRESRLAILLDFNKILTDFELPVVVGGYKKSNPTFAAETSDMSNARKQQLMHHAAICDCLSQTDKWLAKYAPQELATVVHEDGMDAKAVIRKIVAALRGQAGPIDLPNETLEKFNFPLRRIIDTVHFADKSGARHLQLADFCAFMFARFFRAAELPRDILVTLIAASHLFGVIKEGFETSDNAVSETS